MRVQSDKRPTSHDFDFLIEINIRLRYAHMATLVGRVSAHRFRLDAVMRHTSLGQDSAIIVIVVVIALRDFFVKIVHVVVLFYRWHLLLLILTKLQLKAL